MPDIHLIPECYAETEMIKTIYDRTEKDILNHQSGISSVCSVLKKEDNIGYLNIGFIDNDKKNVPHYFEEFTIFSEIHDVVLKKHPRTNDYLFVVKPAIERFLLNQLDEIGKGPSDYGLPDVFKLFCKRLKRENIENHTGFKQMLIDIRKADTSGILFIRTQIELLKKPPLTHPA